VSGQSLINRRVNQFPTHSPFKSFFDVRNEVERYFRRLKGFRRVFTRYDKLDVMYSSFVVFAMICETLRE